MDLVNLTDELTAGCVVKIPENADWPQKLELRPNEMKFPTDTCYPSIFGARRESQISIRHRVRSRAESIRDQLMPEAGDRGVGVESCRVGEGHEESLPPIALEAHVSLVQKNCEKTLVLHMPRIRVEKPAHGRVAHHRPEVHVKNLGGKRLVEARSPR
jgi:hypothetical protein